MPSNIIHSVILVSSVMNNLPSFISDDPEWLSFIGQLQAVVRKPKAGPIPLFSTSCDRCETAAASLYCHQDKSHFCAPCDAAHHASSKLLLRHIRKPIYHSPFQFGYCTTHADEKIEFVCFDCGLLLCTACVLTGSHANLPDHQLVSTVDAFKLSTSPEGDVGMTEARERLTSKLKERHRQLAAIQANANEVQEAIDKQLTAVTAQVECIGQSKLAILQASQRETLLRLLKLEWAESFNVHMRLSSPASLWLRYYVRWGNESTKKWFLAQPASSHPKLPKWLDVNVIMSGSMEVITSDLILPERLDSVVDEWSVMDNYSMERASDIVFAAPRSDRVKMSKQTSQVTPAVMIPDDPDMQDNKVQNFVTATVAALNEGHNQLSFLPEPTVFSHTVERVSSQLLSGALPFDNAVQLVKSVPSSDRANLIKSCIEIFHIGDKEAFVNSIIHESVAMVVLPALAVSAPSLITALAAAVCPSGDDFLRSSCSACLAKPVRSDEDALIVARSFIGSVASELDELPREVKFVLKSVADEVGEKFGAPAGANAATGLFVSRMVSPTLIRAATADNAQLPQSVSLICKQLQRISHADDASRDEQVRSVMVVARKYVTDQIVDKQDGSLVAYDNMGRSEAAAAEIANYVRQYGHYLEV